MTTTGLIIQLYSKCNCSHLTVFQKKVSIIYIYLEIFWKIFFFGKFSNFECLQVFISHKMILSRFEVLLLMENLYLVGCINKNENNFNT